MNLPFTKTAPLNTGLDLQSKSHPELELLFAQALFKAGFDKGSTEINNLMIPQSDIHPSYPIHSQIQNIYNLLIKNFGEETASQIAMTALNDLKIRSGGSTSYATLVKHLNINAALAEKVKLMAKEELEMELLAKESELASIKRNFEEEINIRTKQISAERNKLTVMLSAISDSVIGLDLERNVVIANNAAEQLIGLTKDQMVGKQIGEICKVFEKNIEVAPIIFAPIKTDTYEGVVYSKQSLKLMNARGQQKIVSLSSSQISQGLDVNLGCILTIHDDSKEDQLEKMKLDFVSMAAHELRTPLTALNSYLYIFIKENKDALNAEQNKFLNRMNISTQQLMSLVENLLSVSRIERGVFKVYLEPIDWVTYVKEYVDEMIPRAAEKSLTLTFSPPTLPISRVLADKSRINEVLLNLLANALAYTSPGGKIDVSIEQKGDQVITRVSDTGQGIPPDALPHLFSKFYRVSGKLEQGSKGTGLGLYISKAMIEAHHGTISVDSKMGIGSTFSFTLQTDGK